MLPSLAFVLPDIAARALAVLLTIPVAYPGANVGTDGIFRQWGVFCTLFEVLIPCNDGSRFVYSHTFSDLLVGQMEATLEDHESMYASDRTNYKTRL